MSIDANNTLLVSTTIYGHSLTLLTGKRALAIMIEDFTITLEIEVCDFKLKNPTFFNHSSTHFRSKSVIFTRNNLKK